MNLNNFKSAVEGAFDHIILTDPDGVILYANRAAQELTGYSFPEMKGKTPRLWGRQMPPAFFKELWETIKEKKKPFIGSLQNKRKNNEIYHAEVRITPILDKKKNVQFFLGIERDITKQKEAEQMKDDIISIASHQLKTPLTGLRWAAESLLRYKIPEKQKVLLSSIYENIQLMSSLINDLLNVSRLDSGRFKVSTRPVQPEVLIESVIASLQSFLKKRSADIKFKKPPKKFPEISLDPDIVSNVLRNLITNAVSYTPKGKKCAVIIQLKKDGNRCVISVKDNGIGIPKSVGNKIFDKFFREERARKQDSSGSGLGLYIAKNMLNAASGDIRFESKINKGTTFFVSFSMK